MWRLRSRDEAGAVVVVVALLSVALFGMAALVIDVGALRLERRQLQNGADAAALAVAQSCARGSCDDTLAADLAEANASDDAAAVDSVLRTGNQVRVATSTSTADGGTVVPYLFGQLLTGEAGKTVHASATAGWGPVGRATTVPLAISRCEVDRLGTSTTSSVIRFHDVAAGCERSPGLDAPGGYGWLAGDCPLTVTADMLVPADPGKSGPRRCLEPLVGSDILVPVYGDVRGSGANATYDIVGFAALHLTGYRFPGDSSSPAPCAGSESCVAGYFIRFVTEGEAIGGIDLGASTVVLVD